MDRRSFLRAASVTGLSAGALSLSGAGTASAAPSGPVVDPTDPAYGAVGDGVADDTQALRDALAAAQDGVLDLPPGIYRVTGTLEPSRVMIRGAADLAAPGLAGEDLGSVIRFGSPFAWGSRNAMIDCTTGGPVTISGVTFDRAPTEGRIEPPGSGYPYPTVIRHHGALHLHGVSVRGVRTDDGQPDVWACLTSGGGGWLRAVNANFSECDGGMRIESAGIQLFEQCYFGNNFGPNLQIDDTFNIGENAHVVFQSCVVDEAFPPPGASPPPSARIGGHDITMIGTQIMGGRGEGGAAGLALFDEGTGNRYIGCIIEPWHTNASVAVRAGSGADPLFLGCHVSSSGAALPLVETENGATARLVACTIGQGDTGAGGPGQVQIVEIGGSGDPGGPSATPDLQETMQLGNLRASATRAVFIARSRARIRGYRVMVAKDVAAAAANFWTIKVERRAADGTASGEFGVRQTKPTGAGAIAKHAPWGEDVDLLLEAGESLLFVATRTGTPEALTGVGVSVFWDPAPV